MPGLVPGIHDFLDTKTWMAGTSPAMTMNKAVTFIAYANAGSRLAGCAFTGSLSPRIRRALS
jgi:hypothetical protein